MLIDLQKIEFAVSKYRKNIEKKYGWKLQFVAGDMGADYLAKNIWTWEKSYKWTNCVVCSMQKLKLNVKFNFL